MQTQRKNLCFHRWLQGPKTTNLRRKPQFWTLKPTLQMKYWTKLLIKEATKARSIPSIQIQRPYFCHLWTILPLVLPLNSLTVCFRSCIYRKSSKKYWKKSVWGGTDVTNWNRISAARLTSNVLFRWPWWVRALQACFATWAHRWEMYLACKQCHYNAGEGSRVELVWERKH